VLELAYKGVDSDEIIWTRGYPSTPEELTVSTTLRDSHPEVADVTRSFDHIFANGDESRLTCTPSDIQKGKLKYHFQGIVKFVASDGRVFYYLTRSGAPAGHLYTADGGFITNNRRTIDHYHHPSAMQAIGDYLVVPWEGDVTERDGSVVTFWSLADPANPVECKRLRITQSGRGAQCVGITQISTVESGTAYVLALIAGDSLFFYAAQHSLNDVDCNFLYLGEDNTTTPWSLLQSIGLVSDTMGRIYMIGFETCNRKHVGDHSDYAHLYEIKIENGSVQVTQLQARHMITHGGRTSLLFWGNVHFTWGAGLLVQENALEFFACERNVNIDRNVCWLAINRFAHYDWSAPYGLPGTSNRSPAVAGSNASDGGKLAIVYKSASDETLWITSSNAPPNGDWQRGMIGPLPNSKIYLTAQAPALTFYDGTFYMAFVSNQYGLVVAGQVTTSIGWRAVVTSSSSPKSPTIAVFKERLFMAYVGNDYRMHIATSEDRSPYSRWIEWGLPLTPYSFTTSEPPALASFNGRLYLAWRDTRDSGPFKRRIWLSSSGDGKTWNPPTSVLEDRSPQGPALAAFSGYLYLAYTSDDSDHAIWVRSSKDPDRGGWHGAALPGFQSKNAPSLTCFDGRLIMAWTRLLSSRISVSQMEIAASPPAARETSKKTGSAETVGALVSPHKCP
jgi:hypothetical protein